MTIVRTVIPPLTSTNVFSTTGPRRYSFDLTHLQHTAEQGQDGQHSYLRELCLQIDGVLTNTNAAARTVTGKKALDGLLKRCVVGSQSWQYYDLPDQGGSSLRAINLMMRGRRIESESDLVVPAAGAGGVLTFRAKIPIPFYDLRRQSPEDLLPHVATLAGSLVEFDWPTGTAATEFGADVSITSATARLSAEMVARDELRLTPKWRWAEYRQSATEDYLKPGGVLLDTVAIQPISAAGLTSGVFGATDITSVLLREGNRMFSDSVNPADLVAFFNAHGILNPTDYLGQPEAGTNDLIPIMDLSRTSGKVTKLPFCRNAPQLKLTGAIAVANFRTLELFHQGTDEGQEARELLKSRIAVPKGSSRYSKTLSKAKVRDNAKAAFLPSKIVTPNT